MPSLLVEIDSADYNTMSLDEAREHFADWMRGDSFVQKVFSPKTEFYSEIILSGSPHLLPDRPGTCKLALLIPREYIDLPELISFWLYKDVVTMSKIVRGCRTVMHHLLLNPCWDTSTLSKQEIPSLSDPVTAVYGWIAKPYIDMLYVCKQKSDRLCTEVKKDVTPHNFLAENEGVYTSNNPGVAKSTNYVSLFRKAEELGVAPAKDDGYLRALPSLDAFKP